MYSTITKGRVRYTDEKTRLQIQSEKDERRFFFLLSWTV